MTSTESGRIDGPLVVDHDLVLSGMATGPVTVTAGAKLCLSGSATAGLHVLAGAHADVNGTLQGPLRCAGTVDLTGMINGPIIVEVGGTVMAAEGAHRTDANGRTLVMGAHGQWEVPAQAGYLVDEETRRWPVTS